MPITERPEENPIWDSVIQALNDSKLMPSGDYSHIRLKKKEKRPIEQFLSNFPELLNCILKKCSDINLCWNWKKLSPSSEMPPVYCPLLSEKKINLPTFRKSLEFSNLQLGLILQIAMYFISNLPNHERKTQIMSIVKLIEGYL